MSESRTGGRIAVVDWSVAGDRGDDLDSGLFILGFSIIDLRLSGGSQMLQLAFRCFPRFRQDLPSYGISSPFEAWALPNCRPTSRTMRFPILRTAFAGPDALAPRFCGTGGHFRSEPEPLNTTQLPAVLFRRFKGSIKFSKTPSVLNSCHWWKS